MKRIPPELDSLMWTLAEEGNDRAIDEFGTRHVEHRAELLRRIQMVKGLRGEKPRSIEPVKSIPRFTPRESPPPTRGPIYLVGGLTLAAIGALAFITTTLLTPPPRPRPVVKSPSVIQTPAVIPSQAEVVERSKPEPQRQPESQPEPEKQPDLQAKPGTVKIDHAPLLTVLDLIGETCGVRVDAAPGMPNPEVTVDYRNMSAMDMLSGLGKEYGFTPFDQHDGSILVIPAVDKGQTSFAFPMDDRSNHHKLGG